MCRFFILNTSKASKITKTANLADVFRPVSLYFIDFMRKAAPLRMAIQSRPGVFLGLLLYCKNVFKFRFGGKSMSAVNRFMVRLGNDDWVVEFTDDSGTLGSCDSFFGVGYIYIRKKLSLKKRNALLLEELTKAAFFQSQRFDYMKSLLDDEFLTFAKDVSRFIGQIMIQKAVCCALKMQARKERYKKKIKSGCAIKKQLTFKGLEPAA